MAVTRDKIFEREGQATVEFAVAFPVLLVVAAIAVNATLFLSECAAFDREARQTVRAVAVAPAYGQDVSSSVAQIESALQSGFQRDYLSVQVEACAASGGLTSFCATLDFAPTLFGMGMRDQVLGVPLPHLRHSVSLVVDSYKPGVFF